MKISYKFIHSMTVGYCNTYEMYVRKKLENPRCGCIDLSYFSLDELEEWSSKKCLQCYAIASAFEKNLKTLFDARRTLRRLFRDSNQIADEKMIRKVYEFYFGEGVTK